MAVNLDVTPALNRIWTLLTAAGYPIYQQGQTLPESLPAAFIVLQPLFVTVRQTWASRRDGTQRIQILCVATGPGTVRAMTETVNALLPPTEFTLVGTGWQNHTGTHYEIPVTVTTLT